MKSSPDDFHVMFTFWGALGIRFAYASQKATGVQVFSAGHPLDQICFGMEALRAYD